VMLVAASSSAAGDEAPPAAPVAETSLRETEAATERPGPRPEARPPDSRDANPAMQHQPRFRLHLDARLGLGAQGITDGYGDYIVSGASVPVGMSAGVSVTRALVVFADISDDHMLLFTSGNSYDATRFDLYSAGLGLKFHVTPTFFLSGSGLLARLRLSHHAGSTEDSQWGTMARLSAGTEWPISSRWSVGVGAQYQYGVVHSTGPAPGLADDALRRYSLRGMSLLVLTSFHQPDPNASGDAEVTGAPGTPPAGYRTHDGFYLNVSLGPGWLWARSHRQDPLGETPVTEWSGRGTRLALSAGIAFAGRLIVFGQFSETQVRAPAGETYLASVEWNGFGPGLRYYLMPANVFLAGAFLFSWLARYPDFSSRGFSHTVSGRGSTGSLSVGKEWWVLGDLGIGVAGEFTLGKLPGADGWGTYTVRGLSVVASVSYN
jgi:hypothetical protein